MNKAILMGRLTKDPEMRYATNASIPVCNFTLAVDRRFSKKGEEKQADFINIIAWKEKAEFISKYFTKGSKIAIVGTIQTRTWEDKDGKKHYATDIVADEAYFTEGKANNNAAPSFPADDDDLPF
jgi:single-strand DNA-binding protein